MSTQLAYSRDLVGVYDRRHFGGPAGQYILERDLAALGALLPPPPCRVLDVPCGTGIYLAALEASGYDMVGGDASEPMLETTRARGVRAALHPCDINHLPYDDDSFDASITLRLFSHFRAPALPPMLAELRRVVRPGGRLIFDTFAWSPRQWPLFNRVLNSSYMYPIAPTAVESLIAGAGLRVSDRQRMYLFSPLWQRRLPLGIVKALAAVERITPKGALLRTFWACTRDGR